MPSMVKRLLLASPRGYCAGVERAVETVEHALELHGAVYVRKQIVHNLHVVRDLEARGAVFVEDEAEAPDGATIVSPRTGWRPRCTELRRARHNAIDATCPLVTKVHVQARRYAADGYTITLIGHAGHEEVVGTMGEAPEAIVLVESVADAEALDLPADTRLAYITQTTLSVDETARSSPSCAAASPRSTRREGGHLLRDLQPPVGSQGDARREIDLLLVIGSRNSSNSNRLVDVARAGGVAADLIDDETEIDEHGSTASRRSA